MLRIFLDDPELAWFGLDIIRATGIASGSLYPILHRFEDEGLLTSEWERLEIATREKRRPRRQYRLVPGCLDAARARLSERASAARPESAHSGVRTRSPTAREPSGVA